MTTDEAVNNIMTVMGDCYDAFETLDNGETLSWDANAYQAMGDLLKEVLTKYFYLQE
jgi:hypothetical protein